MNNWLSSRGNKAKFYALILIAVSAIAAVPHIKGMFINIHPGEAGVLWERFDGGTNVNGVYKAGLHIINPFNTMTVYSVNEQHQHRFEALSKEGVKIDINVFIRFTLLESNLPHLHQNVGGEYLNVLILPEIESHSRMIIGTYGSEEIDKSQGSVLEHKLTDLFGKANTDYLESFELTVSEINLPNRSPKMINDKL